MFKKIFFYFFFIIYSLELLTSIFLVKEVDFTGKNYRQINLDSEAARVILSEQIAERIELWQNQKDQENIKKNAY